MDESNDVRPVPSRWTFEGHFLQLDVDVIKKRNMRTLLAQHYDFFTDQPDTIDWGMMKNGDKYQGQCAAAELENALARLDPAVHTWRVTLFKTEKTPNMGLLKSPTEFALVRVDFEGRTIAVQALMAGQRRAQALSDLLTNGVELVAPEDKERERRLAALSLLADRLAALETNTTLRRQARGKRFEAWLGELFEVYALDATLDVRNDSEQIDFTFWLDSLFVIGEARWLKGPVDSPQVRDFFGKLGERPPFVVGLFVSMGGFTEPALDFARRNSGQRTLLTMPRNELDGILRADPELPAWVKRGLRARLAHPQD